MKQGRENARKRWVLAGETLAEAERQHESLVMETMQLTADDLGAFKRQLQGVQKAQRRASMMRIAYEQARIDYLDQLETEERGRQQGPRQLKL